MTWHVVAPELPPHLGGVATWTAAVARGLREAGEEVRLYAPARLGADAVPMRGRSWARWGGLWAALAVAPRLRRGDVVLCATWPLATQLVRRDAPVAVAYHGSDLTRPPRCPGFEAVRARAVHFPVSAYLGALLDAPHTVLPAPVDPAPPTPEGDALLVVARLVPTKGVDAALRLAARLGRPAIVVGDGPERPALEALAASLPVPVDFRGATREIPWDRAWALALLARPDPAPPRVVGSWRTPPGGEGQEGLGLVLLEAAARGIPSIGTAVGGIPEAASVVLADPETDVVPPLPSRAAVREGLLARHGVARTVTMLRQGINGRPETL